MAIEREVEIPWSEGAPFAGVFLSPEQPAAAPRPGLLIIHDLLGLGEDTRRIARRFTRHGYAAMLPDLFDPAGARGGRGVCVARTMLAMQRGKGSAFARLDAARQLLAAEPDVDATRIGIVGFCMGGGFAIFYAARTREIAVCAPFYGITPRRAATLRDVCPVVGGWGERDPAFAVQGRRLAGHLQDLGVPHDIVIYPEAGHAYMNRFGGLSRALGPFSPLRAAYHEASAEDSWRRMLAFFAEHLPYGGEP